MLIFVSARAAAPLAVLRLLFACLFLIVSFALVHPGARAGQLLPQILVIDYQPVSKQPATGGATGKYDDVYRVDLRNAGAAAADVTGIIQARMPAVTWPDNAAMFGSVDAFRIKASTDTITVRASRYVDRRLDKKVQVNGRWRYQEEGSDADDQAIPGLAGSVSSGSDDTAGWYYAIRFQFLSICPET